MFSSHQNLCLIMASCYIVFGIIFGGEIRNPKGEIPVILNNRITCCVAVRMEISICPNLQEIPELASTLPKM